MNYRTLPGGGTVRPITRPGTRLYPQDSNVAGTSTDESGSSSASDTSSTPTTSSGTPSGIYQPSPAMLQQLQDAIEQAFPSGFGTSAKITVSNATIANQVAAYLAQTGQWSSAMIAAVTNALPVGGGPEESQSNNLQTFVNGFYGKALQGLNSAVLSASAPSAGTTTANGTTDDTSTLISDLLPYLEGVGQTSTSTTPATAAADPSMPYYVAPVSGGSSSSGGSPVLGLLLLVGSAAAGIWYYVKHEKKHHAGAE